MRKALLLFLFVAAGFAIQCNYSFGQVSQLINYQVVARNTSGQLIINHNISVRISILSGSASGTSEYSETHSVTTSQFGIFNVQIGGGTVVAGTFSQISWSSAEHFVKVEADENGGSNFQLLGTSQLVSVPYALYADKAKVAEQYAEKDTMLWKKNVNDVIYNSGKVLIGTTSDLMNGGYAGNKLQVASTTHEARLLVAGVNGGSDYSSFILGTFPLNEHWAMQHTSNHNLFFNYYNGSAYSDLLTLSPTGNVGIGLAFNVAPTSKLEVTGTIHSTTGGFKFPDGTTQTTAATASVGVPAGSIMPFAGTTAPTGYLFCDGSAVSRTTYADLFVAMGTSYGSGNGTTTFNLPDFRGRFLRGVDGTAGNDPDKTTRTVSNAGGNNGNNVGSLQNEEFKSHMHNFNINSGSSGNSGGYSTTYLASSNNGGGIWQSNGGTNNTVSIQTAGGTETRPKNVNVNYIIKY